MAESGSDWPYTLAGALLLLTVVVHCAIKISTLIGDNGIFKTAEASFKTVVSSRGKKESS